ncbi:MAG: hypothetical protein WA089_09025, partial [Anaerolineae bacterium]
MKRKASLWLAVGTIISLVWSSALPVGARLATEANAKSQHAYSAALLPISTNEPTWYDRLHHGSPSTPWTAFAGRGVNSVFGNFVLQSRDLVVQG